jgi:GNAT superfamily N-acetyltransferase
VILPEFQGMGIGTAFSDAIAEIYVSRGLRYFSKTAHPSFGEHREKVLYGGLPVPIARAAKAVIYSKMARSEPCRAMVAMPKLLERCRIESATVTNTLVPKNHKNIFAGP